MDPCQIYKTCIECVEKACANLEAMGISKNEIKSIGIANQRETSIVWDKETGKRKSIMLEFINHDNLSSLQRSGMA
jgi:glycerol kinase